MPNLLDVPGWADSALQGITYWIGWNHTKFRHWPLTEGAIVAELQRLIDASLESNEALFPEVNAHNLVQLDPFPADIKGCRYDMVVAKRKQQKKERWLRPATDELSQYATAVIEVKRNPAFQELKKDIRKLANLAKYSKKTRFFVVVTSEGKPFTKDLAVKVNNGDYHAKKTMCSLNDGDGTSTAKYKVRRLCRALSTVSPIANKRQGGRHYACLIEVWPPSD